MLKAIKRIGLFYKVVYLIAVITLLLLTIILKGNVLSLLLTVCGITATVLNTRGIKACFPLYFIQVALYGFLAIKNRFFGEAVLNLAYAAPMYIYAFIFWKKRAQNRVVTDIYTLNAKQIFFMIVIGVIAVPLYGAVLGFVGTALPYLNAAATFIYAAIIFLVSRRYIEQWVLWNVYTILQFVMWLTTFSESYENISIGAANVFYFILNIAGLITWIRLKKYLYEETEQF